MNQSTAFEALESRAMLSGVTSTPQYYPEGFANAAITEVVTISNPGTTQESYELWAHYETGVRDQLLSSGTVAPGLFADITLSDAENPAAIIVRKNAPFALELRGSSALSATLRHDDYGGTVGESFSATPSPDWSFTNVERSGTANHDFIVLFNPDSEPVDVRVQFWTDTDLAFEITTTVDGLRRGGWNINKLTGLTSGEFGVTIQCSGSIFAALSHYNQFNRDYSTIFGNRQVATAGIILSAGFDSFRPPNRPSDDTVVRVFNPGTVESHVTLTYTLRDGSTAPAPTVLTLAPRSASLVSLRGVGIENEDVSVLYESDNPVSVGAVTRRHHSYQQSRAAIFAATQWKFATAWVDRVEASVMHTEDVLAFNPTGQDVSVTFQFFYRNGTVGTETRTVAPGQIIGLEDARGVQGIGAGHPLSIQVSANGPIVAGLEHWNRLGMRGRFQSAGTPTGTVSLLSSVIV